MTTLSTQKEALRFFKVRENVDEYQRWLDMPNTQRYIKYAAALSAVSISMVNPRDPNVRAVLFEFAFHEGRQSALETLCQLDAVAVPKASPGSNLVSDYGASEVLKEQEVG